LIKARQVGGACHEGYRSCFFRRIGDGGDLQIMMEPVFDPDSIYGSTGRDPQGLANSNRMPGSAEEHQGQADTGLEENPEVTRQCVSRD
jgi:hypothetical protein